MSFPRYPAYKLSGVEWLGEVPEHWPTRRLGYYFAERREKVSDKCFTPLSVTKDGIVPQIETAAKTDDGDNRKRVCVGDFVINSRSDRKGSSGLSELDGSVSLISTVLKPKAAIYGSYVHHLLRSVPFQEEFYRFGKGIVADLWSTNYTAMSAITLAIPPICEQESIATFLDRETAKIDALIAEQQRLIELLQEKRQAVISHAVTKGLNPDAPMKDMGVEWLGEVPEHWEVKRVRHLLKSLSQGSSPNCLQDPAEDGQFGVLKVGCVNQTEFIPQENKALPGEVDPDINSLVLAGDVLLSRGNTKELVGLATVVPQGTEKLLASDLIFILRLDTTLAFPEFIALSLRSDFGRSQIEPQTVGTSASMQKINQSTIKELIVTLPPLMEQIGICGSIRSSLRIISSQIQNCSSAIALLQERRSVLISATVTGQIDVRGLVPVASAA
jgi:type I restriction enzyme S subunit